MAIEPLEARQLLSVTTASDDNVLFETVDQNMWDSGAAVKIEESFDYDLLDVGFDALGIAVAALLIRSRRSSGRGRGKAPQDARAAQDAGGTQDGDARRRAPVTAGSHR